MSKMKEIGVAVLGFVMVCAWVLDRVLKYVEMLVVGV